MSMRKIYRKVARRNHVSVREVKTEMQKAIDEAWTNPDKTPEVAKCQNEVKAKGGEPTVEEVLMYAKSKLKQ